MIDPTRYDNHRALSGLIPHDEGLELVRLAAAVPSDRAIVELGSYRGKSTSYLAAGARDGNGAPVFAIDPWDLPGNPAGRPSHAFDSPHNRDVFEAQLRSVRLWSRVTPIQSFAVDVAAEWHHVHPGRPAWVGLLFVDANHDADAIRADIEAWWPHMDPVAGVIALDDIDTPKNPGVRVVADELLDRHGSRYRFDIRAERLAVFTPVAS